MDAELSNKTAVDVQLMLDRDQHVGNGREQILTLLKLQRLVRRLLTHVTMFIARLARLGAILSHKRNVLGCRGWRKGKGGEEVRGVVSNDPVATRDTRGGTARGELAALTERKSEF